MDPVTVATSVVGMLIPYLIKGGEAITSQVVDETFKLAGQLYQTTKLKFSLEK